MPRWLAWVRMPLSPVGEAASITIASTRRAIRLEICCDCLLTSLPELYHEPSTSDLNGSIWRAALKTFSISMRHLLPMNELARAILYFFEDAAAKPEDGNRLVAPRPIAPAAPRCNRSRRVT